MPAVIDRQEENREMDRESTRVQRTLTSFLVTIGITIILLLLLEVVSFAAMRVLRASVLEETPGKRLVEAYKGQSWAPALAREEKTARETYDYKPFTIWRSHPFQGEALNIDEDGLRRTYHSHCENNEFTVWMFGGST